MAKKAAQLATQAEDSTAAPTKKTVPLDTSTKKTKNSNTAEQKPKKSIIFNVLAAFAVIVAVFSGLLSVYLGTALKKIEDELESEINGLNQQIRTLDDHPVVIEIKQRVLEQDSELATSLAGQQAKIDALQQSFETTQQVINRDQRGWILAEVEYLMRLAITRLSLTRDVAGATEALITADKRLNDLADPAQLTIREILASEITALRSLNNPDTDGAALKLLSIANRLHLLPPAKRSIRQVATENNTNVATSEASFWQQAWMGIQRALGISKSDTTVSGKKLYTNLYYIEQLIRLEIEAARQAILRLDKSEFERRINTTRALLDEHYNRSNDQVIRIRADLAALQEAKLFPDTPDISGSLRELRKQQLKYQPTTSEE